ncbi:UDPglucose 6-dehydrogenase [Mycobacterium frederiksbergense]|uniref:UDP-glucose 6-dehydrogenase n=1 Tax=Mycolicibacterium frederiksbergense TaxID=117567 RepID=A0ABT6KZW3_9MYCO|nr:UDP-glucose/GDP-mannose dehydrogenase family protein [Mycolicibacterium frederiksbergense]MDH6196243.1 UDPglucose 6-dehydrogenase [Mycolicibacterium frederiksbergense]
MRIAVIGTGYVGLVSGVCMAEMGHDVVCVDVDPTKIEMIRSGKPPIHERDLPGLLEKHVGTRLHATTDLVDAVASSEISLIAVGTPFADGAIDLSAVRTVAEQIGAALRHRSEYHVVVVKSTVVPGTTENVVLPILEAASGKTAGIDFGVGMNPEFLTEGEAVGDFLHPDRIVLGGLDDRSLDIMASAYESFSGVPVIRANPRTAEMIKYASNTLLATMISLSNEFANLAAALGDVDIPAVMAGVHLSRYLTTQVGDGQQTTAPLASFLYPGCGYGGSCLPKDTKALISQGAELGSPMRVLEAVDQVNVEQPTKMLDILRRHFPQLSGLRVTILGLSFRPGTDDMRESPAFPIIRELEHSGAEVGAYDPIVTTTDGQALAGTGVKCYANLVEAIRNSDALLLVTQWEEFDGVPDIISQMTEPPLLVDGRRMIALDRVPRYDGIGV